jgi:excisionase family DNA binding protein
MDALKDRVITAPVAEFCILSGLGRTKVYEMLGDGSLKSIKLGKRRLVVLDSYRELVERQLAAAE